MAEEPTVDMQALRYKVITNGFWAARGHAIQSYADLEQAQCQVFSALAGTTLEIGRIIFFRIVATDARLKIIEKLFRVKFRDEHRAFRKSLFDLLAPINITRNEIVHWNAINLLHDLRPEVPDPEIVLVPPAASTYDDNTDTKRTDDLLVFIQKCWFYTNICRAMHHILLDTESKPTQAERDAWLGIFAQAIVYPPPEGHPLFLIPHIPATRQRPFDP